MTTLTQFSTPAMQEDFPEGSEQSQELHDDWSTNLDGFTQQAITGNPWNGTYQQDQTAYYNPLHTDIPPGDAATQINWVAFPGRIDEYLGEDSPYTYTQQQLWELADTGATQGATFPQIPTVLCPQPNWSSTLQPYGPYGPRGWQDEYSEWSVTRNADNKIIRVDFTCENPEYWYTLWRVSPEKVAELYTSTLNCGLPKQQQFTVTVEDLELLDPKTKQKVIDPSTGRAAYNPLNKWNSGPVSIRTGSPSGGAMHLTSTPNTLQTETGLAASATVQRTSGNTDPQVLICCGAYGQNYRHSDPHIGQAVNTVVSKGAMLSLANPPGLYIQMPDFSGYSVPSTFKLPDGAKVSDCWQIVRGVETLIDPVTGDYFPGNVHPLGNFILHAVFQLPQSWVDANPTMTVSDILINNKNINWGSQIAETYQMALYGRGIPTTAPAQQPCVQPAAAPLAQPLQMMYKVLWDAYYNTEVSNPVGFPMNLASNTVIIPPAVPQGTRRVMMALTCALGQEKPYKLPTVTFSPSTGVRVRCLSVDDVTYAVPGNSYPSPCQVLTLRLDIDANAELGLRGIYVTNPGQQQGQAAPAFLNIVKAK